MSFHSLEWQKVHQLINDRFILCVTMKESHYKAWTLSFFTFIRVSCHEKHICHLTDHLLICSFGCLSAMIVHQTCTDVRYYQIVAKKWPTKVVINIERWKSRRSCAIWIVYKWNELIQRPHRMPQFLFSGLRWSQIIKSDSKNNSNHKAQHNARTFISAGADILSRRWRAKTSMNPNQHNTDWRGKNRVTLWNHLDK